MTELTLCKSALHQPLPGPVGVIVMDGVGIGRRDRGDAVWLARTPTLDALTSRGSVALAAHGTAVGMPADSDMGNSEVGHNVLGCGRVFDQGAKLVAESIQRGRMFKGAAWRDLIDPCLGDSAPALHFIGLLSDGNVHSHVDHLRAMLRRAAGEGVRRCYLHILLDGRDVPPLSALLYVEAIEALLAELRGPDRDFRIASGGGRMVTTMDRYEADWSIVQRGWQAHVLGEGRRFPSAAAAINSYRGEDGVVDQFLPSFVIADEQGPVATIEDGDSVVLFNFRGDRALQISRAFTEGDGFSGFERQRVPRVRYAGMMQYDGDLHIPARFLVEPPHIDRTMGEHLARSGVSQFACAETQKFGHVTYFWNGNRGGRFDEGLEEYLELPSDRLPFEQRPWMQAAQVTDSVLELLKRDIPPRFLRVNYANGDMVGHSGSLDATVLAVEALDLCLARLLPAFEVRGGALLITADHGNADQMFQIDKESGSYGEVPLTSHTLNPVPAVLFDPLGGRNLRAWPGAGLASVPSTALELLGFEPPEDYAGSLLATS